MPAESWADLLAGAGDAANAYELLDEGNYDVVVTEAAVATAKSSGNKMYNLTLSVESGPHAKRKLWTRLVVARDNLKGMEMFFKQMAALTLDGKFFSTEPDDDVIVANLIGKRASAKVVQGSYNETPKNDVKFLNPPKGPAPVGGPTAAPAFGAPPAVGAPPVGPPPVQAAPPVAAPAAPAPVSPAPAAPAPPATDPWANSTPPTMPGLGQEDPF